MPAVKPSRGVRAHRQSVVRRPVDRSSSLPPSSPPASSSPPPSPGPLPRASSPDFPLYVLPGPVVEEELRKLQEPQRKELNRQVLYLQKKVAELPDNAVWQARLQHALEDYKELFGAWIADEDLPAFDAERKRLLKLRETVATTSLFRAYSSPEQLPEVPVVNPAYIDYFDGTEALFNKFGVNIEPQDELTSDIGDRYEAMVDYQELEAKAGGDRDTMVRLALKPFVIDVRNPYPQADPRRTELNALYRVHLYYFARGGGTVESPPDMETKTHFEWICHPDTEEDHFIDVVLNYTRGVSFKASIEKWGKDACKAAGILSAESFYGAPSV
ncbi:hypothetical protein C8F04DRAFT_1178225 [Mycena alexandri]|uniref:Uncharacterized protein n=1 Tax=Mycena alexandri TaxID=1745969 RepID=A0AAD6T6Q6_9AGAR|nr:hypothetical protein C8F04DRAFT_1178225 [Mycena alexandri]